LASGGSMLMNAEFNGVPGAGFRPLARRHGFYRAERAGVRAVPDASR